MRATREQEALISQAAALKGWTVTQFVVDTAVERADEIVRKDRTLMLPNEVFDQFIAELDSDAREVPQLVELFNRTDSPLPAE